MTFDLFHYFVAGCFHELNDMLAVILPYYFSNFVLLAIILIHCLYAMV